MDPVAGAPSDNTTLVAELQRLRDDGYDGDFFTVDGPALRCGSCRHEIAVDGLELDALRRLEGASDPADMAAIVSLSCPSCDQRGTAVLKYGPEATAEEDELLRALPDVERAGGTAEYPPADG